MSEKEKNHNNQDNNSSEKKSGNFSRRDVIKGMATVPVLGALAYGAYKKEKHKNLLKSNLQNVVDLSAESPVVESMAGKDPKLRVGIIGYGIRGKQLMKAAGFAFPGMIDNWKESAARNSNDKRYQEYLEQEDLNIEITAVCDLFDSNAEKAQLAAANKDKQGSDGKFSVNAKRFRNYKDLMASELVDAVIIAVPDHWHSAMVIEAARQGKHVYVEKGLTRKIDEAYQVREAVKNSNIVFQLGHQGRQTESYMKAKEAIDKNVIGKVNLIEVCTNRNSPNGAWVYDIDPAGNPNTIDWDQFEEPCEVKHPFNPERFFRWRCWWDYGTGLSGDLLTHEFDAINQILNLGIPHSAVASGGVYFFKDKSKGHYVKEVREVPDVFQANYEYPDRDISLLYSASLASNKERGKVIMGHDGYIELGNTLQIYADRGSDQYRDKIDSKQINPDLPIFTYIPGRNNVDAVATPTEQYFAGRGLLYTYRGGKRVDTTHLHIKEWIDCIRASMQKGEPVLTSCNIDQAFEEAVSAHMATIAYRENRKVFWDSSKEEIV